MTTDPGPGTSANRTLIVVRHAKSDWDIPVPDRDRPLAARGRRQAPASGRWLAAHGIQPSLALVSPATRARQTWDLVAAELAGEVRVEVVEAAYTFDGGDLWEVVNAAPAVDSLALVSHNPAVEDLIEALTGTWVRMPTSALAVVDLPPGPLRAGAARLRYAGRPADA